MIIVWAKTGVAWMERSLRSVIQVLLAERMIMAALRDTFALPSAVLGPVDFSHGRHCWIIAACRCRRSCVQVVAIGIFQLWG